MPTDTTKYLVHTADKEAQLVIRGRAGYLNCMGVSEFFDTIIRAKYKKVTIDLKECTGLDSTFLGIIAKLAIKLKAINGSFDCVILTNLEDRNLEVVKNLGINKITKLVKNETTKAENCDFLGNLPSSKPAMLEAHKSLIEADKENAKKFEDVISFLSKGSQQ